MRGSVLRIMTYHRVVEPDAAGSINPSLVSATPAAFAEQMRHLARRYRVVSADDVVRAHRGGPALPDRAVLITFDDGYRDVGETAWPILKRLGLPATVFVPTAYVGGSGTFWWDRLHQAISATSSGEIAGTPLGPLPLHDAKARRATLRAVQGFVKSLPHEDAMRLVDDVCERLGLATAAPSDVLGWSELRQLAREGMTIGAHTRTHPALNRVPVDELRAEVRGSRDDVAREIGSVPCVFAYPFGAHDARAVDVVREEGFDLAVTCRDGHNRIPSEEPLRLFRTNITPRTTPLVFRVRLSSLGPRIDRLRHGTPDDVTTPVGTGPSQAAATPAHATARTAAARSGPPPRADGSVKVAYIMSRFPKLTETFILNEIIALESLGAEVAIYPLLREREPVAHPEAERLTRRAHFHPFISLPILGAQLHFLRRDPSVYASLLLEVLRRTWGSANFFVGALGVFPKAVRFAYELQRSGVQHVHAHFCSHPAVAAFIVNRLTGIPFSFTAHGSDLHVERRMLDAKVERAAFAVTISEFNKRVMVDECGEAAAAKIRVVHCGVDVDAFSADPAERADGPLRIICVASFEEVKGHRHLLDACALLRQRGLDLVCDLIGEGPLRRDVEARIAELQLGDRVRVLGGKPRPEVIRMLRGADVAVLASQPTKQGKREGIPVVLMEAMASGLPVVSSAISGIPELVDDGRTGLLVPPRDPVALADALARLAADPQLRRRMGAAGRERVVREFNLRENAAELLTLFRRRQDVPRPVTAARAATAAL